MSIYEVILYVCLFAGLASKFRQSKASLYIISFLLFIIAAMRGLNVGVDTINYYNEYKYTTNLDFSEKIESEYLFWYLTYLFRKYLNYDWYMIFNYLCIIAPVALIIRKYSPNYFFSLFLYIGCGFYMDSFNVMRQFLATSILFITFIFLEKDTKVRYLFWPFLIMAYFIHNSSLIVAPLFFIRKIDLSKTIMGAVVLLSFFIGFFVNNYVSDLFQSMVGLAGRFDTYLEYTADEQRNFITNFGMNLVFLVSLWLATVKTKQTIFFKAFFVSMIVFNLVGNMYYMTRLTFYYSIAQIICIPLIVADMSRQYKKEHDINIMIKLSIFLFMIVGYGLARFYMKELPLYLPYSFRDLNLAI